MLLVTVAAVAVALVAPARAVAAAVDTAVVGSSVHEALLPAPSDLQTAAAGDRGYHHTHKTRGGDGYKHFDSFHKKDGDSFGYEKHSKYGKGDKGDDGREYHEASSYSSDDGDGGSSGSGTQAQPKVWHYESRTGTPSDPNYDPETYEGDYTQVAPRVAPHPDVEVVGALGAERYQVLRDASGGARRGRGRRTDPQAAGTEEDAEYDYYEAGSGEGDDGGSSYYEGGDYQEGGDYEGEGEGESDYYY